MTTGPGGGGGGGSGRPVATDRPTHAEMFARFAEECAELRLYGRLAEGCSADDEVAGMLARAWPGQDRPVLLFAAVHDLVLRRPHLRLARWYPSVTGAPVPAEDPWPEFRATCREHADELGEVIARRSTQTNEVNRCVLLAPLLAAACADERETPLALFELGPSAGLLLGLDRYRIELGDDGVGDPASPVRCAGERRGPARPALEPFPPSPPVVGRTGLDLHPVDLADLDERRWLEACLWPDLPERLARFRAAAAVQAADPPRLVTGDMVDDLGAALDDVLAATPAEAHLVVFHCWALTYVERSRRARVAEVLAGAAADGRPVSWLSAEPPRCAPGIPVLPAGPPAGETVLGLRRWRAGGDAGAEALGSSHPHGTWVHWTGR